MVTILTSNMVDMGQNREWFSWFLDLENIGVGPGMVLPAALFIKIPSKYVTNGGHLKVNMNHHMGLNWKWFHLIPWPRKHGDRPRNSTSSCLINKVTVKKYVTNGGHIENQYGRQGGWTESGSIGFLDPENMRIGPGMVLLATLFKKLESKICI